MGIASLIFGLASIFLGAVPGLGIILGLLAIIFGIIGRRRLLEEGRSTGVATGGMVTGALGIIGSTVSLMLCLSCLNVCGSSGDPQDVSSGMDWAQQQAETMSQNDTQSPTPSVPPTPTIPATPVIPATPATPATPAVPSQAGGFVTVGTPLSGIFSPGLPVTTEGRPYMDFTLNVAAPGTYTFNLVSSNTTVYDPFLRIMQGAAVIEENDDAGNLNSQIQRPLVPGTYTIRVMSFMNTQVTTATPFTLTVNGG